MKDPSKPLGDSLGTHKTQNTAEQTMERLIFSLSELEHLGQTLISGHSNFNYSSKNLSPYHARDLANQARGNIALPLDRQNLDVVAGDPRRGILSNSC